MADRDEGQPVPDGGAHRLRVHACQRSLRWVVDNAAQWTSGHRFDGSDLILLTIFARSTRTYEAIVRWLGEHGFGEQGMMLNRSLFEDMIDAHWVHLNPTLAVQRLEEHDLYSRLLRLETQRRLPEWFRGEELTPIRVSNEERKRLRGLFGKGGSRSWTGERGTLEQRVEGVLSCWPSDSDRQHVREFTAWVVKIMNEVLHPSAFSLGRIVPPFINERNNYEWRFGSTPEWLAQSLYAAFWTYHQIVGLIVEKYANGSAFEAAAEEFTSGTRDFATAAEWDKPGEWAPAK